MAIATAAWRVANPEIAARWGKENPQRRCQITLAYYGRHPEKKHAWQKANPVAAAASTAKWRVANPEKVKAGHRAQQAKYPEKSAAKTNRRRAQKLRAMPAWANAFFIEEAYDIAKRRSEVTGIKWHVDHIVPLKSKLVCGLHVEHNLAVIPATVNWVKGARHWPDAPSSIESQR